jgi:outer membrane protein OmpA-like peptidoglycan-associated protein
VAADTLAPTASSVAQPVAQQPDADTLQVGATIILHNIFFDFDKAVLLQQSYNELQQLLEILQNYPKMRIEVRGHTDGHGSADYNQRLSENRAKAVVDYLVSKGIDAKRLQYKGYGKTLPIATNATEEGRARNRRVEFKILSR